MQESSILVVLVTFPDQETAQEIGSHLVQRKLIACINCIPSITSIYQWEGKICEDQECLGIMKTASSCWADLEKELLAMHPYEVPEIVALEPQQVSEAYQKWVLKSAAFRAESS